MLRKLVMDTVAGIDQVAQAHSRAALVLSSRGNSWPGAAVWALHLL